MSFRKKNPPAFLLHKATSADLRELAHRARHAMAGARGAVAGGARQAADHGTRLAAHRPARWTAGIAAAATIGAIAASAPWAGAAASTTAEAHGGQAPTISAAAHSTTTKDSSSQSGPQTIYDSVIPTAIPSGQQVATYSDGPFQASSASVAGRGNVLWIDVNGSDPSANALDVEPGDATPAQAASWVSAKLTASPSSTAIVYTFISDWGAVGDSIATLPSWMQSHVKYWIADPTGTPHILPGAAATQWYWGSSYDISLAQPGFFS